MCVVLEVILNSLGAHLYHTQCLSWHSTCVSFVLIKSTPVYKLNYYYIFGLVESSNIITYELVCICKSYFDVNVCWYMDVTYYV